jgi:hypothetical protein
MTSEDIFLMCFDKNVMLHGSHFHRLYDLENSLNKAFHIQIQNKTFHLTAEETFLISPKTYKKILTTIFTIHHYN